MEPNWEYIYDNIDELIDLIVEVIGYSLPDDYRIGDESGEDAFAREIIHPLNNIQHIVESVA